MVRTESSADSRRPLVGLGDDSPFELRLARAIAWCAPRADLNLPEASLRSAELLELSVFPFSRASTVRNVLRRRAWHDAIRPVAPVRAGDLFGSSRLLAYLPDDTLADGAAELDTHGFFDADNVPPWDTWVGLFPVEIGFRSYASEVLISWVPPDFLGLVDQGIRVNPEECITWLADLDIPMAAELRARGLLLAS